MKKRRKQTLEHRRKNSEANKCRIISPESRKKTSETLKEGYRTGRLKQVCSDEKRRKVSESKLGIQRDVETCRKISEKLTGHKRSEESKRKQSETNKGRKRKRDTVEKIRKANTGQKRTDEQRKRISESRKGYKPTEETIKNIKESFDIRRELGLPLGCPKGTKSWSKGLTKETDERIKKSSVTMKESWLNLDRKVRSENQYKSGYIEELGHYTRSSWEKEICLLLKSYGIEYKYEPKRYKLDLGNDDFTTYLPDLYIPRYDLFVEIKGWFRDKLEKKKIRLFRNRFGNIKLINKNRYERLMNYKKKDTMTFEKLESVLLLNN